MQNQIVGFLDKLAQAHKMIQDAALELRAQIAGEPSQALALDEKPQTLLELLMSDKWPKSVEPEAICPADSEQDKIDRGVGLVKIHIGDDEIAGKKFLDFGCGEGHCVLAAQDAQFSVGYDTKSHANWTTFKKDNNAFTTNFQEVVDKGPYDTILAYDVIDHLSVGTPVEALTQLRSVLADNGKILLHCHPFCSRHATHVYHDFNKAFAHLVFTPEELKSVKPNLSPCEETSNAGVVYPVKTYEGWIKEAGLKIASQSQTPEPVEAFFKTPEIAARIMKHFPNSERFPEFQLGICFIDFVLKK